MKFPRQSHERLLVIFQTSARLKSGDQHQVQPGGQVVLREAERFPQQPLEAVPPDRFAVLAGDAQAEAGPAALVGCGEDQQMPVAGPPPQGVDAVEVRAFPQSARGGEPASLYVVGGIGL